MLGARFRRIAVVNRWRQRSRAVYHGQGKRLDYAQSDTGIKVSRGISSSRIRGVRLTLNGNQKDGRAKSELSSEFLDMVVYEQPRHQKAPSHASR